MAIYGKVEVLLGFNDCEGKMKEWIKQQLNKVIPEAVIWAVFVIYVLLVLLWFGGYFGF